jgi:5'-nucleotidase
MKKHGDSMTYILTTNDDGYDAPGILALSTAMREFGAVGVVAPARNQSASGHKKTLFNEIPYFNTQLADESPVLAVDGSPADCIAVAALGAYQWPPDLVVSGINRGANLGQDVTYSGTVTAALEASIHGVPAVAFSLESHDADKVEDYAVAAKVAIAVVRRVLNHSLPPLTILNVNIPNIKNLKGIRITKQGIREYCDELVRTENTFQIAGPPPGGQTDKGGTDLWALHNGYVSVTPIHLDLTAHRFMADLASWNLGL